MVLREIPNKSEGKVTACGVALEDDVGGGEAEGVGEVVVPCEGVEEGCGEGVDLGGGGGGGGGEAVFDGEGAVGGGDVGEE